MRGTALKVQCKEFGQVQLALLVVLFGSMRGLPSYSWALKDTELYIRLLAPPFGLTASGNLPLHCDVCEATIRHLRCV